MPQVYHAFVRKEVILSAGAIHSPALLMLSGIGSKNELQKLKVIYLSKFLLLDLTIILISLSFLQYLIYIFVKVR